jgi:hypothetical protein
MAKRGRPKGSKSKPIAKDVTDALYYIADATKELTNALKEFGEHLEQLKDKEMK